MKTLTEAINELLAAAFPVRAQATPQSTTEVTATMPMTEATERLMFTVRSVHPSSPASSGGLREGDYVISIKGCREASLVALRDAVSLHEGTTLQMEVKREQARVTLEITPRRGWGGPGLLGAALEPI